MVNYSKKAAFSQVGYGKDGLTALLKSTNGFRNGITNYTITTPYHNKEDVEKVCGGMCHGAT